MLVQKGNGYYLISGYREWQLALRKLGSDEKINCQVVTEASPAKLNSLAWHDAYGCMLAYGISPKKLGQQFKQVLALMDDEVKQNYFAELSNVSQLKKATDMSRGTFYSPKADKEAEHQSFDDILKDVAGNQG